MDLETLGLWLRLIHAPYGIVGIGAYPRAPRSDGPQPRNWQVDLDDETEGGHARVIEIIEQAEAESWAFKDMAVRVRHAVYWPSTPRRWTKDRIRSAQVWMVDLDQHDDPTAVDELVSTSIDGLTSARLPPPTLVMHTGWGAHLLWVSIKPLGLDQWSEAAKHLRAVVEASHVPADLQTITDPTRPLRPPGATNWRSPDDPKTVRIVSVRPKIDPQALLVAGGLLQQRADMEDGLKYAPKPVLPWKMAKAATQCAILADVLKDEGASCSEPQWRTVLQLCAFATDGDTMAHEMSRGHVGYDYADTTRKLNEVKRQIANSPTLRPHNCNWLRTVFNSNHCASCPLSGRIRSPAEAPVSKRTIPLSKFTNLYGTAKGYECFGLCTASSQEVLNADGSTSISPTWRAVAPWTVEDLVLDDGRSETGEAVSILSFAARESTGHTKRADLDMTKIYDVRSMNVQVAKEGLSPVIDAQTFFRFLQDVRSKLTVSSRDPVSRLGFAGDLDNLTFVHGGLRYKCKETPTSVVETNFGALAGRYRAVGTREVWQAVIDKVLTDTRPAVHAVMALAVGSPLVRFTDYRGLLACLWSPETGVGKTTLMKIAQSLWGDPTVLGAARDTAAAMQHRLGVLNNLPAFMDEYRALANQDEALGVFFDVESGKSRLKYGPDQRLAPIREWRNTVIYASNFSIQERIARSSHGIPGAARLTQLRLPPRGPNDPVLTMADMTTINNHYGWAGPVMAKALLETPPEKHIARLEARRRTIVARLKVRKNTLAEMIDTDLRFLVTTAAVAFYGGELARENGLLPGWREDLALKVFVEAAVDLAEVIQNYYDEHRPDTLLRKYISTKRSNFLVRHTDAELGIALPTDRHAPLLGELDRPRNEAKVALEPFEEWLRRKHIDHLPPLREFIEQHTCEAGPPIGAGIPSMQLPLQKHLRVPLQVLGLGEEE